MPTVAIAGGTGRLGLTFAETLKDSPIYKVIVLARNAAEILGGNVSVVVVDYTDFDNMSSIFEANAVHTVISTLQVNSPESGSNEINLVKAAEKSTSTFRFISSDWASPTPDFLASFLPHTSIREATRTFLATETKLEWTTFRCGQIMDYLGTPHLKSHLGVYTLHIDIPSRAAAIPGSGDERIAFTLSWDLARFVEAALGMPRWERELYCYSDVKSYNQIVRIAEDVTGQEFAVTHDPIEKLEKGKMTELPSHVKGYARFPKQALQARVSAFGLFVIHGVFDVPETGCVLNETFPEIETMAVEDIIGIWAGK